MITVESLNLTDQDAKDLMISLNEHHETKRKNGQVEANVREWEDMDNAPKDQPLILKDDNGFIYVGEYNHNYGYFGQYTDEGVVEHQHAMKWKPLPTT